MSRGISSLLEVVIGSSASFALRNTLIMLGALVMLIITSPKLTALVDIVNQLLVPASTLPPRQLLRFNAVGALLPASLVPAGDAMLLRLRFDLCRSLSLELPARMGRRFDDGHVFVEFTSLGDVSGDAIERLVFRHHRRKVAEARQTPD